VRDEDRLRVGLLGALDADRLRAGRRLGERLLLQPAGEPDPGGGARDDTSLVVDDEEGQPHAPRPEVRCAGDDRNVVARSSPERLERTGRRLLARLVGGAAAARRKEADG
jgi:hypothetical protein